MAAVGAYEDVITRTNGRVDHNSGSNGHIGHLKGPGVGQITGTNGTNVIAAPMPASTESGAATAFSQPMRSLTRIVQVFTERHLEFVDITDEVRRCLDEAGVQTGFVVVFSKHSTAGIRINEHEPLLLEDMAKLLESVVPQTASYRHDDFSVRTVNLTEGERVNGHSHCRSLLLGASETIPVAGGQLMFGRWQRVFLVELDGPRTREFVIQVIGA